MSDRSWRGRHVCTVIEGNYEIQIGEGLSVRMSMPSIVKIGQLTTWGGILQKNGLT
jgi:hypothetical protein